MNNKFENENEEEKLFKKNHLGITLHKNTESLDYLYASKALYPFSYKLSLYIKARLKKCFSPSFPKK